MAGGGHGRIVEWVAPEQGESGAGENSACGSVDEGVAYDLVEVKEQLRVILRSANSVMVQAQRLLDTFEEDANRNPG